MIGKPRRDIGIDPSCPGERGQRVHRRRHAQRRIAPAVDELMNLREKFDLANAAAAALEVKTRAECLPLREMVADAVAHRADFLELAKIEAAPPDEGLDRVEEMLPERAVARRRARTDEGRLLPCQRLRLIIGYGGAFGQDDRRHLGVRAQAQIDAQHMAIGSARRQDFDHPPRDPHRRLIGVVARAARHGVGIEDQDRVDVRRIVEFVAAELAERNDGNPARRLSGDALGKGCGQRRVAGGIGKGGEVARRCRHIMLTRQIAEREQQRRAPPPPAQRGHDVIIRRWRRHRRQRRIGPIGQKARHVVGIKLREPREKRGVGGQAVERGLAGGCHRPPLSPAPPALATLTDEKLRPERCFRRRTAPAKSRRGAWPADMVWSAGRPVRDGRR